MKSNASKEASRSTHPQRHHGGQGPTHRGESHGVTHGVTDNGSSAELPRPAQLKVAMGERHHLTSTWRSISTQLPMHLHTKMTQLTITCIPIAANSSIDSDQLGPAILASSNT